MTSKLLLRITSALMLLIAIIFLIIALTHPELGSAVDIGGAHFGAEQWRICYAAYAAVILMLFISSFLTESKD